MQTETFLPEKLGFENLDQAREYLIAREYGEAGAVLPEMHVGYGDSGFSLRVRDGEFPMTPLAFEDILGRFDVPVRAASKWPRQELTALVNALLTSREESVRIQSMDGTVTSVLQHSVVPVSNLDFVDALDGLPDIHSVTIFGRRLVATAKTRQGVAVGADELALGMELSNDEDGRAPLRMQQWALILRCTNGLLGLRQHNEGFAASPRSGSTASRLSGLRQAVGGFSEEHEEVVGAMRQCLSADVADISTGLRRFLTRQIGKDEALASLTTPEPAETLWQVIDRITDRAKELTVPNRARMERTAGEIVHRIALHGGPELAFKTFAN